MDELLDECVQSTPCCYSECYPVCLSCIVVSCCHSPLHMSFHVDSAGTRYITFFEPHLRTSEGSKTMSGSAASRLSNRSNSEDLFFYFPHRQAAAISPVQCMGAAILRFKPRSVPTIFQHCKMKANPAASVDLVFIFWFANRRRELILARVSY